MNPNRDENVVGIQALNSENEATRFDEALNGYFRSAENDPEKCLKQLKQILRDAEAPVQSQYIRRLHAAILHQLKRAKTSPTVFSRAVQLCQEIFKRSTVFRALIATQTSSFFGQLLLAAGEDPNGNVSKALRARNRDSQQLTMVLGLIETWKQDFGDRYPSIVAAYSVLEGKGYRFPHERERQQEVREREVNTRRHRERVRNAKKQQRDREMKRYVPEMEQVLVEMNRVFEILQEDVEWESEVAEDGMDINDIVQAYGLGSSSYQLTIEVSKQVCEESSENDALYRTLADGALRIRKRFKPLLDDWEQHSTLEVHAPSDSLNLQPQREVLQRINDLRDRMTHTLLKWDDLVHDSKKSKRDDAIQSAVVSVPLDSYNLPTKRKRRA
ncbi:uncharacterized protein PITG_15022 [Phytophthora infestans T30-4]|uniref:VHS domain-containing protein n=1 Tax=Phytophthora infestans (strain T30-4) TaxID=403677 RepID=D0NRG8_PHYIT|nr:uncharacterized protein PITG_15022 [Phytophthora infestans T30-4]EEY63318.1 conserved hypothetical protein [Phytophthora infestans T30-4]|eukprot:XP_002898203.1 conserved hypothetical protein [Phytophthora infestans T30-4]